jgi:hypothetical protein
VSAAERRVVVALDLSPASLAALETAVLLATRLDLPLLGLYVEDEALRQLAELPVTRVLGLGATRSAAFEPADVARAERVRRARARAALEARARRAALRWDFQVARGAVAVALRGAVGPRDLLAIGRGGRSADRGPGHITQAVLEEGPALIVVAGEGSRLTAPVAALDDGTAAGRAALAAAAELARALEGQLLVLLGDEPSADAAPGAEGSQDLEAYVRARLPGPLPASHPASLRGEPDGPSPLALRVRRLPAGATAAHAAADALAAGCGTLVVPARGDRPSRRPLWATVARAGCPVVVVRPVA